MLTKGAPEAVLARCVAAETDGLARPLDAARRQQIDALQERYNREGYRLLAVAIKTLPQGHGALTRDDEQELTLIGFCVFTDPVKTDAAAAVAELTGLGINLKIISGDQPGVVQHVARAVGLPADRVLTGSDIAGLTESGLAAQAEGTSLFARVDPEQKRRIINALRRHGHVVGFMGDGVNDAPAIHAAHVGLSVDGATEVARAAADMILLAADLSVLAAGVREGRRTLANILKYVRMGTSSNFGNMLSMALASVVLPFLPLLPLQILLNNLLYDLSEIGIPFDDVDQEDVAAPHGWDMPAILRFTLIMGAISSLFDAATFLVLLKGFGAGEALFQTGWFLESITTQILVIFLIRSSRLPWQTSPPNAVLAATSLGALGVAVFIVLGPFRTWFGFTTLSWPVAAVIVGITGAYLWPRKPAPAQAASRHAARAGLEAFRPARPQLLAQDQGIRPRSCAIMNIQ
jgi:Mg2+-importing ATPase